MTLAPAPITIFQEKIIPGGTRLAGWAALIHALALPGPVRRPSCVSEQHVSGSHREEGAWTVFDKRYWPGDTLADHLAFALRHAAIDLLDSKAYFTGKPRLSKRHRVRDNLLGTGRFCPVIRRTRALTEFLALDLSTKARETVGRTGPHL